jgi:imidazolonepropionase-like amidohydrolase
VSVLRVRGYALPEGEPVDLYADGDRWATEPVAAAELVAEGWLLPGLVDAHTHPGARDPGQPLDDGPVLPGTARAPARKGVQR